MGNQATLGGVYNNSQTFVNGINMTNTKRLDEMCLQITFWGKTTHSPEDRNSGRTYPGIFLLKITPNLLLMFVQCYAMVCSRLNQDMPIDSVSISCDMLSGVSGIIYDFLVPFSLQLHQLSK